MISGYKMCNWLPTTLVRESKTYIKSAAKTQTQDKGLAVKEISIRQDTITFIKK